MPPKGSVKPVLYALLRMGRAWSSTTSPMPPQLVKQIGDDRALAVQADASKVEGCEKLVDVAVKKFGKIDVLIPNAGMLPMKDLEHTTEADFDATFSLNVKGPYFLAQVCGHMYVGSFFTELSEFCASNDKLQLPHADKLRAPLRSNVDAQVISEGLLHDIALMSILTEVANWHLTLASACYQSGLMGRSSPSAILIGPADSFRQSLYSPNAFSNLGTLREFLTGKVNHSFGWTGPSITYDTACSSSAVAIHATCKALQLGECSKAVAGGVSIFTSPYFYQNLAVASFLSPTGPTKPLDATTDGYCRGEGVGLVVLKELSSAIADEDNVLSVILATAVNQCSNTVTITAPHSPSQINLFRKLLAMAHVKSTDVSYVETHGTRTPVRDPLEFESIRKVYFLSRFIKAESKEPQLPSK